MKRKDGTSEYVEQYVRILVEIVARFLELEPGRTGAWRNMQEKREHRESCNYRENLISLIQFPSVTRILINYLFTHLFTNHIIWVHFSPTFIHTHILRVGNWYGVCWIGWPTSASFISFFWYLVVGSTAIAWKIFSSKLLWRGVGGGGLRPFWKRYGVHVPSILECLSWKKVIFFHVSKINILESKTFILF